MSVSRLGDRAFYGCESLTQINIPDNITRIPMAKQMAAHSINSSLCVFLYAECEVHSYT